MERSKRTRVIIVSLVIGLLVGVGVAHLIGGGAEAKSNITSFGAPPLIPHTDYTYEKCTDCHGPSTHAAELDVPTTPHSERQVCRQCHVPLKDSPLFRKNAYRKP